MSKVQWNDDEVVELLRSTSVWGVTGISQFLLKNVNTLAQYNLTIIDKQLISEKIVERRIKELQCLTKLDHPSIYKIKISDRTLTPNEILGLEVLSKDPTPGADLVFTPTRSKHDDGQGIDTICIKVERAHPINLMAWIQTNHYRKDDPIFHQQQIVIIQNLVGVVKYLHKEKIPTGSLVTWSFFCGESDTSLNSPLIKVDLSQGGFQHVEAFSVEDDITQLSSLFQHVLMWGNPLVENGAELMALSPESTADQIKVQVSSPDNKFQQLMSFLRNPEQEGWMENLAFTRYLGSGAFGLVMSAMDLSTKEGSSCSGGDVNHYSAIKVISGKQPNSSADDDLSLEESMGDSSTTSDTEEMSPRYKANREFENMKACQHQNLTKLFRFEVRSYPVEEIQKFPNFEDENYRKFKRMLLTNAAKENEATLYCIEMELCGSNLRTWLDNPKLEEMENLDKIKLRIIRDLIQGMKYLHSKDILHRDFKPANIFFASHKEMFPVKIGDFGLTQTCSSSNDQVTIDTNVSSGSTLLTSQINQTSYHTANIGTYFYQAPEVRSESWQNTRYGKQADIYSLGLVLLEIVQSFKTREEFHDAIIKLVEEKDATIICDQLPIVRCSNVKSLIIQMTKEEVEFRMKSMSKCLLIGMEMKVETEDELKENLGLPGTLILSGGIFQEPIILSEDGVNIMGNSTAQSIFQNGDLSSTDSVFTIIGNNCRISNLKIVCGTRNCGLQIVGSNNKVDNVTIESAGDSPIENYIDLEGQGVIIEGGGTIMSNITISKLECAIQIKHKGHNDLSDLKLMTCNTGVEVCEGGNTIKNVSCEDCSNGISLNHSDNNVVENISCQIGGKIVEDFGSYGISVAYGKDNVLRNISCNNYSEDKNENFGVYTSHTTNFELKDSKCGPILLGGINIRLENVDGDKSIVAKFGSQMTFVQCRSKMLKFFVDKPQLTIEKCRFEEIVEGVESSDEEEDLEGFGKE